MNTATLRPHQMSLQEAIVRIGDGRLTCEALVRDCLDRINERESQVQAWSLLDPELAIRTAQQLDRTPRGGLLHGIPIGVKDIIETCDMPTEYGSPIYRGHRPAADAGCVAMANAAGAVILGKTITTEFASSHPGKTTNPHNPAHTPGGSSSGSAAAVADYMVPLAIGTQTGGSVIRPASFCGVVGFKPSFGLITRTGVKQLADSLDTVGVFGRNVGDIAIFTAALTGRPELALVEDISPPRIGFFRMAEWPPAQAETVEALAKARQLLHSNGCAISECELPAAFDVLAQAHHDIEYFELARALRHEYRKHSTELSTGLRARITEGLEIPGPVYEQALCNVRECRIGIDRLFSNVDVLIAPSAPGEAPVGLTTTGKATFNRVWTLLGLPAITIPLHRGPHGLPVGVQIIGRYRQDRRLLAYADWIFRMEARTRALD
jgi:Asp-tRNA(Asn)/Glu-tRNA(Gln) amidotransferase A subunit family amidase